MRLGHCTLNGRSGHEAGLALLKALFREEMGREPGPICTSDRGKPYFADKACHFSLSHTPNHAFCVLSRRNVGLDAEELGRVVSPHLPRKVLSAGELAQYESAWDKNRAFLTFWVLKEAAAKLRGTGLTGYPNDTNFSLDDPRVTEMDGCLVAVLEEGE